MLSASQLRHEISARNRVRAERFEHEVSVGESPSVIYSASEQGHGNFLAASWRRIQAVPQWKQRLSKVYTASRHVPRATDRKRYELECASSSDALLMNIFCYPRVLQRPRLCALLGIGPGLEPEFGFRPGIPLLRNRRDRTEIDMRLGDLLLEAKLTEGDFQRAPIQRLGLYCGAPEVFAVDRLPRSGDRLHSWQLIRGVLAAHAYESAFLVLCDRRRPDLIDRWFPVMSAVIDASLRTRLGLITWQELAATLPDRVQLFLEEKYGICA